MVKNKKALSAMVGYVLLITFGIILSVIVYNYLQTYVPKDLLECPDGVSILIKDYSCQGDDLNITFKNNGKFNYAGYFIHGANETDAQIATLNLANNFLNSTGEEPARSIPSSYVSFSYEDNDFMKPQNETVHLFDLNSTGVVLIEITPVRFQEIKGKERFVSCGNAKIREEISC